MVLGIQYSDKYRLNTDSNFRHPMEITENKGCWICDSTSERSLRRSTIISPIDPSSVRITDSNYGQTSALRLCCECGFIYANPLPHHNLIDLYRDMFDPEYLAGSHYRKAQMARILDVSTRYHPNAENILDIGAGLGLLLEVAKNRGFSVDGVEPSRWCVDTAARINGIRLHCGTIEECSQKLMQYDLVSMIDVIEHTSKPIALIRHAKNMLKTGGRLIIVTIDIGSPIARLMGKRWWHHRIAHVGYFNRKSMRRALNRCGLELIGDHFAGWRFPLSYIWSRMYHYIPIPPFKAVLNCSGILQRLSQIEISLYLGDSRIYVAKKEDCK